MCICRSVDTVVKTSERMNQIKTVLGIDSMILSEGQQIQLTQLLYDYSDVFALNGAELGCTNVVRHCIDTGDSHPVKQQPYRTPFIH